MTQSLNITTTKRVEKRHRAPSYPYPVEREAMPNRSSQQSEKKELSRKIPFPGFPQARIVWLRQQTDMDETTQQVYDAMVQQGFDLTVTDVFSLSSVDLETADLVLLDAFDKVDAIVETVVSRIRMESRVPLIMLTNGYSTEQLISALVAGVDAIWSLNTPVDVLLMRCRALLRRWLAKDH